MTTLESEPARPGRQAPPSLRDQLAAGRAVRKQVPRDALADLVPDGRDPMAILDEQDADRLRELVSIRAERMAANPFAFFRGTAGLMAADLARSPHTGLTVGSCGDAHVSNFGLYASPQRTLVFDLNDFDEAAWAPWEWDLKRLVTSIVIAGQSTSRDDGLVSSAARSAVVTYARGLHNAVKRGPLRRYYDRFDAVAAAAADPESRRALRHAIRNAEKHTGALAAKRLTTMGKSGRLKFVESPPTMTRVDRAVATRVGDVYGDYVRSASVDIRVLLQNYAIADVARRVVGVGSVGTRCYLLGLQDGDDNALLLQAKEAGTSVLIRYGGASQPVAVSQYIDEFGDGGRVVAMQRVLQAVSDPFLGHLRGVDAQGTDRAFYVRQFHDMKGGFDMDTLEDEAFLWYADACAATLARAHSQSPDAATVAGYVGRGGRAAEAILAWSYAYAALSRADWELFRSHRRIAEPATA
ncbi:DUF2252 domain-containing protein [Microbacterium sp.]|uniref:DUF2252 domain-containing protein n=1 Tax=Microbacterium sp. TaxID=51671 RepID=UPI0037CC0C2E